ncbi:hypothetical protein [Bradyrhizobium sp. CCGUVB1N3]|uniref:hypothetical protein n=1 Tax=Bradyrhizobium sp. CCGUVB1N3 TaxID=2949629 RepID=UPI0035320D61
MRCAGVLLFGLVTCRLIWMLPAERRPVVIVGRNGIRDLRIGNEFLLWDSIQDVLDPRRFGARKPRKQNRCVDIDAGTAAATSLRQEQARNLARG